MKTTIASLRGRAPSGLLLPRLLASAVAFAGSQWVRGQIAGSLDPDFRLQELTGGTGDIYTAVVGPDGKILIGGSFTSVNGTPRSAIARLHPDGTPDATFDAGSGLG